MPQVSLASRMLQQLVPQSCYQPADQAQARALTRFEKLPLTIDAGPHEAARRMALRVAEQINVCVNEKGHCVMSCSAGLSTLMVLRELVQLHREGQVSFSQVIFFAAGEVMPSHITTYSVIAELRKHFLSHIDIAEQNVHDLMVQSYDVGVVQFCRNYEQDIAQAGGIDVMLCQLNDNGGLEFNIPGSSVNSTCRLVLFDDAMRTRLGAETTASATETDASLFGLTLGVASIMQARHVFVPVMGEARALAVCQSIEGPVCSQVPGSYLQLMPQAVVGLDLPAACWLTRIATPWLVTKWQWTPWWVTRAAMWLSTQVGKPLLRLSVDDYTQHELTELINRYGSAPAVNLIAFNHLERAAQIWPGGLRYAAQADVSHSRVLVLSPLPDDATLCMGASLQRMVRHGRQVHVAFVTSGDLGVPDDELITTLALYQDLATHYGWGDDRLRQATSALLAEAAEPQATPSADMRFVRGQVREAQVMMGLRQLGIEPARVHSLELPCYAQAPDGNGPVTQADVDAIKGIIAQIKPHHIFLGYDPGDFHDIHERTATATILAIDELASEPFMQQCRVWVFRGVRHDWPADFPDMITAIDPTERQVKRRAVFAHQSQLPGLPESAEEGNPQPWLATSRQVNALGRALRQAGLGAFGSCEGFVEYAFRPGTGKPADAGPLI